MQTRTIADTRDANQQPSLKYSLLPLLEGIEQNVDAGGNKRV
jgi:hypothetical protein